MGPMVSAWQSEHVVAKVGGAEIILLLGPTNQLPRVSVRFSERTVG
jgi:hypothetical protein